MSKWVASWATERRSRFARICNLRYSASGKFLIFRVATAFFPPFFLHLVSSRAMTVKADAPADLASRIRSRGARCVLRWQRHTVALPCALRARQTNHWRLRRENQPAAANHRERGDVLPCRKAHLRRVRSVGSLEPLPSRNRIRPRRCAFPPRRAGLRRRAGCSAAKRSVRPHARSAKRSLSRVVELVRGSLMAGLKPCATEAAPTAHRPVVLRMWVSCAGFC